MKLSDFLRYAERQTRSIINIDAIHPCFYAAEALKLAPEQHVHRGTFCEFAKRYSSDPTACSTNKMRSRRVASYGKPFSGICPYGLWELAWPVMHENEHLCTVYLGHYGTKCMVITIGDAVYDGLIPPEVSKEVRCRLREFAAFITNVIRFEVAMWLGEGNMLSKHKPSAFYHDFCVRFIEHNYRENIQLQDLACALDVSPNYLSTRIRQESGCRFTELLTKKRMEVASTYLEFELGKSVSDIAYLCGFQDSNYFSTVFCRYFGLSPLVFRKQRRRLRKR